MATTSADDIEFHYDVGNDFYALWLDETLTYSAALWDGIGQQEPEGAALARAQRAKFAHHLDLAKAPEGNASADGFRLLDVGCGWGGLLDYAVGTGRATEATGLTLSRAQFEHVAASTRPGVEVALEGWEKHRPARSYDGIVSVGAFEHFVTASTPSDERVGAYESYFERCHGLLRPGGSMSLQTIAYDGVAGQAGPVGSFITGDIFPGGTLPRLAEIAAACDAYFAVRVLRSCADDYARTLAVWYARLSRAHEQAQALVGSEVVRRYRLYLRACETTFRRGGATLYRIGLERRDEPLVLSR
ncbi:MAG TPA: cyclopropane-fatty-acyl-phospholipid synthase family protein [Mycobacteriales bacterium]|jgi:cyclopropane-fatty-acyl-phospholipid synthase|nr:cyclopropane-fatty-acyl-phospholipid synthase family protein [Mycobacteriales bacterium]